MAAIDPLHPRSAGPDRSTDDLPTDVGSSAADAAEGWSAPIDDDRLELRAALQQIEADESDRQGRHRRLLGEALHNPPKRR